MPGKCVVPHCKSGYVSSKEKVSLFRIRAEQLELWNKYIPRTDRLLTIKDHVCEKHFTSDSISREWISADGMTKVPYKIPRLVNGAVPTIFPNCPKDLNKKRQKRKLPASRTSEKSKKKSKLCVNDENESVPQLIPEVDISQSVTSNIFDSLWNSAELVKLPTSSWGFHKITLYESRRVAFVNLKITSEVLQVPVIERQIIITDNLTVQFCNGSSIISLESLKWNIPTITTVANINEIIEIFSSLIFCSGGPKVTLYPQTKIQSIAKIDIDTKRWRHKNCEQICTLKASCGKCASIAIAFDRQLRHKKNSKRVTLENIPSNNLYNRHKLLRDRNYRTCLQIKNVKKQLKKQTEDLKEKYGSYNHLSVTITDLKYQDNLQTVGSGESDYNGTCIKEELLETLCIDKLDSKESLSLYEKENSIGANEDSFTYDDNAYNELCHGSVKIIKCELVQSDFDVSGSLIEDSKDANSSIQNDLKEKKAEPTEEKEDFETCIKKVFKVEINCADELDIEESYALSEKENDLVVKEEFVTSVEDADMKFYHEFVKSVKCDSIQNDSDVSVPRTEDNT